jgi:NADPH-dependent curcumin reductase CurA
MTETNRAWVLVSRPKGDDFDTALKLRELPVPELGPNQLLVRTLYLSLDPANRGWMAGPTYMPAVPVGAPMWGGILGRVVRSTAPNFQQGDVVGGFGSWSDYCVLPAESANKMRAMPGLPLSAAQGLFGGAGGTAYVGVIDIGQLKPGQTFVVSGAAGSVGSLAGQIAKIQGAGKVIGIAGSAEKCAWLTDELGFDHAIDYQHEDVKARLAELAPNGVDVYFENVGGAVGNAVIANIAQGGRVALCGLVSQYNADGAVAGLDLLPLLIKAGTVQGFILLNHLHRLGEASAQLAGWLAEGRIKYHCDIVDGLENALDAFKTLFRSGASHRGKLMVRVDPSAD